jgi:16S rRNA (cytosine967-C5)-methyltransferase
LQEWKAGLFEFRMKAHSLQRCLRCAARYAGRRYLRGAGGKSLVMAAMMQKIRPDSGAGHGCRTAGKSGERLRRAGIHNVERKLVAEKWSNRSWRGKFDRVVSMPPVPVLAHGAVRLIADGSLPQRKAGQDQETQAILLEKARAMVVPGGRIIYITCSVLASEGALI